MTAINIILRPTDAHILTDGAYYNPDGTLTSIQSKVQMLPALNMVLTARGYSFFGWRLAAGLSDAFGSFDAAVEGLPGAFEEAVGYLSDHGRDLMKAQPYELFVAGISDRSGRAEAYAFLSHASHGLTAKTALKIEDAAIAPSTPDFMERLFDIGLDPTDEAFDMARDGLKLIEEQRAFRFATPSGDTVHAIGGFCQLTVVSAGAITTRIVKRWPDRVGELILA